MPVPFCGPCQLADIFQRYGEAYQRNHPLSPAQRKAVWAITHCRTAAWVAARQEELLPVPYFHNVFTLPHELNGLILSSQRNQRALLGLLFDAAAQTLLEFGRHELAGKVGFTLVLHTWDQQLQAHFHRFLRHILPDRFLRIRHYGLLANSVKYHLLPRCRELLGARPRQTQQRPQTAAQWMQTLLGMDITRCPSCGETLSHQRLRPSLRTSTGASLSPSDSPVPLRDTS